MKKIKYLILLPFALLIFQAFPLQVKAQTSQTGVYGAGFFIYDYYLYGSGNGFSIFTPNGSPFAFIMNPANGADLDKNDFTFLASGFGSYFSLGSIYNFETLLGNLTLYLAYLHEESVDFQNPLFLKLNFSKMINENFWVGVALNMYTDGFSNAGFNIDFGIMSMQPEEEFQGFGVKNFAWGFVLNNLGIPIQFGTIIVPPIGVSGGISFDFLNLNNKFIVSSYSGVILNIYPFGLSFGTSLDMNIFNLFTFSFGVKLAYNDYITPFSYHFGLSTEIPLFDDAFLISYSLGSGDDNTYTHTLSVNYTFGGIDKESPTVVLKTEENKFSPNYDGKNDEINFFPKFEDNSLVFGWKIIITDEKGNIVKEFIGEDVRQVQYITLQKILQRLFAKKEAVKIPEFIAWDGTDQDGKVVPDGKYLVYAVAWDEKNNMGKSEIITIYVDTNISDIKIKKETEENYVFSPNGDGNKDKISIPLQVSDISEDDTVVVQVMDSQGNVINTYTYTKKDIEDGLLDFSWDGKTAKNQTASEGTYTITATVSDVAGNTKSVQSDKITLITKYETLNAQSDTQYLSPNGDGTNDTIVLKNNIDSQEMIKGWTAEIKDEEGNIVKTFSGEGQVPEQIIWDGSDNNGKQVSDGNYTYTITADFTSGNNPESNEVKIIKDTTPANVIIKEAYLAFSPNDDGNKDDVTIEIDIDNPDDIESIVLVDPAKPDQIITVVDYRIVDGKILVILDGKDKDGQNIPQGNYQIVVKTKDEAGNKKEYASESIKLVRELEKVFADSNLAYYSPNQDGRNDSLLFTFDASEKKGIVKTIFYILDEKGNQILKKEFKGFTSSFTYQDKLSDGKYFYFVDMEYEDGNIPRSYEKKYFIADSTNPEINLSLDNKYFSPNQDGIKDTCTSSFSSNEKLTKIEYIVKKGNNILFQQEYDGNINSITFDGKNFADGKYALQINYYDMAGNKTEISDSLFINTEKPVVKVKYDEQIISPNNDSVCDTLDYLVSIADDKIQNKDKFDKFIVYLKNSLDETVYQIDFKDKITDYVFKGLDKNNKPFKTGVYKIIFEALYASGISNSFEVQDLMVDLKGADVDTAIQPNLFSPDNDGQNDELYISFNAMDNYKISSMDIKIYRIYDDGQLSKEPFKVFSYDKIDSNKFTKIITWDGKGDKPDTKVDSAADYKAYFVIRDYAGNITKVEQNFYVDILVEKIEKNGKIMYRIILNSITFDTNSYKLKSTAFKVLDQLINKLVKFKDYKIRIVGHTDSVGDEVYNMNLSTKRAKSVYDYLIKNDIDPARLTYEGAGETDPIDSNDTEDGRRRNRRVEFYLEKP